MNKRDYVSALRAQLKTLPSNDVEEIAKEFEAHFDIGVSEGKTEEEIAAKLGSPEEVAQIYLSDTVPGFDVAAAANAANAPQFPIIPIKTGWVLGRGVGPQTIAGFCDPASAKPVVNSAPKKEPEGYKFAHTGAKDREEYVNVGPQGKSRSIFRIIPCIRLRTPIDRDPKRRNITSHLRSCSRSSYLFRYGSSHWRSFCF